MGGVTKGSGANFIDITGQVFGEWKVLSRFGTSKKVEWTCQCSCGSVKVVKGTDIRFGKSKSCGCLAKKLTEERKKSSLSKLHSTTYNSWCGMKQRCLYTKHPQYKDYGGRGVKVCSQWLNDFEQFLKDLGPKPDGMSLDRIDVNADYSPANCKWSTRSEQSNNTRRSIKVNYLGRLMTLKQVSELAGVNYWSLHWYFNATGVIEEALEKARNMKPRKKTASS